MSIQFSDTSTKKGLIQIIEKRVFGSENYTHISGNTSRLQEWTASINLALDEVFGLIFASDGTWQFDDSNHTDYPIITTNLVASRRDYPFTTDENSNLILDVYKVLVKTASNYPYEEIYPIDAQSQPGTEGLTDGLETEGTPYRYDKTANGIFLDPVPNADVTNGLKVYINREGSYFITTDTTKKPGFAGIFHELLALIPMVKYGIDKNLSATQGWMLERDKMIKKLEAYYGRREKDIRKALSGAEIIYE